MAKKGAGRFRHVTDIYKPSLSTDSFGANDGAPIAVRSSVPCSIDTLNGREAELARSVFVDASHKVELYADPIRPIDESCYLTGGTLGKRRLNIGFVNDPQMTGLKLILTCGEAK
jgi:hypothetical protein